MFRSSVTNLGAYVGPINPVSSNTRLHTYVVYRNLCNVSFYVVIRIRQYAFYTGCRLVIEHYFNLFAIILIYLRRELKNIYSENDIKILFPPYRPLSCSSLRQTL